MNISILVSGANDSHLHFHVLNLWFLIGNDFSYN